MSSHHPKARERWKSEPDDQDYPAARSYLSLLVPGKDARRYAKLLSREKRLSHYKAKDILRASGLALLAPDDHELEKDRAKIRDGIKLSPVLLVRGEPLWVADGYHRICASYHLDEDALIPCRLVDRFA